MLAKSRLIRLLSSAALSASLVISPLSVRTHFEGVGLAEASATEARKVSKFTASQLMAKMEQALVIISNRLKERPAKERARSAPLVKALLDTSRALKAVKKAAVAKNNRQLAEALPKASAAMARLDNAYRLSGIRAKPIDLAVTSLGKLWKDYLKRSPGSRAGASKDKAIANARRIAALKRQLAQLQRQRRADARADWEFREMERRLALAEAANRSLSDQWLATIILAEVFGIYSGYYDYVVIYHPDEVSYYRDSYTYFSSEVHYSYTEYSSYYESYSWTSYDRAEEVSDSYTFGMNQREYSRFERSYTTSYEHYETRTETTIVNRQEIRQIDLESQQVQTRAAAIPTAAAKPDPEADKIEVDTSEKVSPTALLEETGPAPVTPPATPDANGKDAAANNTAPAAAGANDAGDPPPDPTAKDPAVAEPSSDPTAPAPADGQTAPAAVEANAQPAPAAQDQAAPAPEADTDTQKNGSEAAPAAAPKACPDGSQPEANGCREPQTEAPKAEEPQAEAPKADEPQATEPPQQEQQQEPVAEPQAAEPQAEAPKAEEPQADEQQQSAPAAEPQAEEQPAEEPQAEQPPAEEPQATERQAEEPQAEEPQAEQPQQDEQQQEQAPETCPDGSQAGPDGCPQPQAEEPRQTEEPQAEQPQQEEEQPQAEEPQQEEQQPQAEEPQAEQPQSEEPQQEQAQPEPEPQPEPEQPQAEPEPQPEPQAEPEPQPQQEEQQPQACDDGSQPGPDGCPQPQ